MTDAERIEQLEELVALNALEYAKLELTLLQYIRVANECDTVCAAGSPCLCVVEHQMWLEKE
jgi:hypothetical protein